MEKIENVNPNKEEIARACREFKETNIVIADLHIDERGLLQGRIVSVDIPNPAPWAFEHEGKWYCLINNERPRCATEDNAIITRKGMYTAVTGGITERAVHYVCGVKNGR